MILQSNNIKRGDWLLNVPLDSGHLVNDPHRAGHLIANSPLFMLLLINTLDQYHFELYWMEYEDL